ncbi:hypothetical protein KUTeg_014231 [Tegillarca granosa]|uniref:Arpin n=1 Tax=Tegillarca granosa TaxID=220873 RepID=A0ABQ9F0F1_TEGGR|nr:hypothetical protein KUTeg_014231 [Tegillarca granosa]
MMSRLYDNKPLLNLPIINIQQTLNIEKLESGGDGVIVEGVVKGRSKFSVTDLSSNKRRYYILHLKVLKAHRRKFNSNGQEEELNFSETQKVCTGYLNSSYKVTAKGVSDRLSFDELQKLISKDELSKHTNQYKPEGCIDCVSLWLPENQSEKIEIDIDDSVRVKTEGNSPFICK